MSIASRDRLDEYHERMAEYVSKALDLATMWEDESYCPALALLRRFHSTFDEASIAMTACEDLAERYGQAFDRFAIFGAAHTRVVYCATGLRNMACKHRFDMPSDTSSQAIHV